MTTANRRPATADHLRKKKPRRITVGIYLDDAVADRYEAAERDLRDATDRTETERPRRLAVGKARAGVDASIDPGERAELMAAVAEEVEAGIAAELDPLREAVDKALADLDAETQWFTFRALGRARWEALVTAHEPQEIDHEQARAESGNPEARAGWHYESLAPELLVESSLRPKLTDADVAEIFSGGDYNGMEVASLVATALVAQTQSRAVQHRQPPNVDA